MCAICPMCGRCARWPLQHICVYSIFPFDLYSLASLDFFSPAVSYSVIITTTKEAAFPLDSGKVPLAMVKCTRFIYLFFFSASRLLSRGNMSVKLD